MSGFGGGAIVATIGGSPTAGACTIVAQYTFAGTPAGVAVFAWASATLPVGVSSGFQGNEVNMLSPLLYRATGWLKVLDTTGSSTPQGASLAFTIPPIAAPFLQAGGPFYGCVTAPGAAGAIVSLSGAPS